MQYVRSKEDADEIVNDTFMAIWDKRDEMDFTQNLKPLLYTIVRNKSLNLLKKRKIEITDVEDGFEIASDIISPVDILQAKETEEAIYRIIDKLPPKCKQIFIMSRKEFLNNKEIAAILEITEKTVENQITIAIRTIKAGLNHKKDNNNNLPLVIFPWLLAYLIS